MGGGEKLPLKGILSPTLLGRLPHPCILAMCKSPGTESNKATGWSPQPVEALALGLPSGSRRDGGVDQKPQQHSLVRARARHEAFILRQPHLWKPVMEDPGGGGAQSRRSGLACVFHPSARTQMSFRERVMSNAQPGGWQGPFKCQPSLGARQLTNLCIYPGLCPTLCLPSLFSSPRGVADQAGLLSFCCRSPVNEKTNSTSCPER